AMAYLESELWTPAHLIQQFQLLVFASLAFMLLLWRKYYPAEQPGLIIDAEWLWRRGGPQLLGAVAKPAQRAGRVCAGWLGGAGEAVRAASRQVFASDGWVATKIPASATALWSLAILGLVLVVTLFG
ncbi:MAG: hypothetical protein ABMA14_21030, partial [Hyphomonadaceae bacterium]